MTASHAVVEAMRDALSRIERFAADGEALFHSDPRTQDAIIKNFIVVGEAAKRLSDEFRNRHSQIPWKQVAGFRDVLVHQFDAIRLDEVWTNTQTQAPQIKRELENILASS